MLYGIDTRTKSMRSDAKFILGVLLGVCSSLVWLNWIMPTIVALLGDNIDGNFRRFALMVIMTTITTASVVVFGKPLQEFLTRKATRTTLHR